MELKVHLDAGHYGKSYNRSTTNPAYYESAMNWKLTNFLKTELEKRGVQVTLSRNDINSNPSLYDRGYGAKGCDLFLSIHSNACGTESVDYPVVYRGYDKEEADELGLKLADLIESLMETRQAGRTAVRKSAKNNNEYYGVLRGARNAGLTYYYIIEHSFHTNSKATEWLLKDSNLQALAVAEAECIVDYFKCLKGETGEESQVVPTVPALPTEPTENDNIEYIWHRLLASFRNPYGVAGLMGNLQAESGFSPINLQNTFNKKLSLSDEEYTKQVDNGTYTNFVKDGAGYGLAQWTYYTRKSELLEFAKARCSSIGDIDTQIDFLIFEIMGYSRVYNAILNYQEINAVSNIVLTEFERPADQSDKVKEQRYKNALNIYNMFMDKETVKPVKPAEPTISDDTKHFKVKILASGLNIRAGAGTNYKAVGCIRDYGVYTIIETNSTGTWGKLKSGAGWISLNAKYVRKVYNTN